MTTNLPARRSALAAMVAAMMMLAANGVFERTTAAADSESTVQASSISVRTVEVREPIPYETIEKPTNDLRVGTSKTTRPGVPGEAVVTYRVTMQNEREIHREVIERKILKSPVPEIVQVGRSSVTVSRGRMPSRGYFAGRRVLTMIATGYDPSPASNGGYSRTSTGLKIGHGVVAVDPRVIPIGTRLYIEGYGYAVAADVGGAIKGNRIDLGHDSSRGARNIGRRVVRVHILD